MAAPKFVAQKPSRKRTIQQANAQKVCTGGDAKKLKENKGQVAAARWSVCVRLWQNAAKLDHNAVEIIYENNPAMRSIQHTAYSDRRNPGWRFNDHCTDILILLMTLIRSW